MRALSNWPTTTATPPKGQRICGSARLRPVGRFTGVLARAPPGSQPPSGGSPRRRLDMCGAHARSVARPHPRPAAWGDRRGDRSGPAQSHVAFKLPRSTRRRPSVYDPTAALAQAGRPERSPVVLLDSGTDARATTLAHRQVYAAAPKRRPPHSRTPRPPLSVAHPPEEAGSALEISSALAPPEEHGPGCYPGHYLWASLRLDSCGQQDHQAPMCGVLITVCRENPVSRCGPSTSIALPAQAAAPFGGTRTS